MGYLKDSLMRASTRAKGVCDKMTKFGHSFGAAAALSARATELRESAESMRNLVQRKGNTQGDAQLISLRSTSSQRVQRAELPSPRLSENEDSAEEAAGADLLRSHIQKASDTWGPVAALDCIIAAARQLEHPGGGSHTKVCRLLGVLGEAMDNVVDVLQSCWHPEVALGSVFAVAWDTIPAGPAELRVGKGDRIKVLKADGPGWQCRNHTTHMDGWVPHSALALATPSEKSIFAL